MQPGIHHDKRWFLTQTGSWQSAFQTEWKKKCFCWAHFVPRWELSSKAMHSSTLWKLKHFRFELDHVVVPLSASHHHETRHEISGRPRCLFMFSGKCVSGTKAVDLCFHHRFISSIMNSSLFVVAHSVLTLFYASVAEPGANKQSSNDVWATGSLSHCFTLLPVCLSLHPCACSAFTVLLHSRYRFREYRLL